MANINFSQRALKLLESISNGRAKDVIARRFGLAGKNRETLESIGQDPVYQITRERVRQIESVGLGTLSQAKVLASFKPEFEFLKKYLVENGGIRREEKIFEELGKDGNAGAVLLFLTLGNQFHYCGQEEKFDPFWATDKKLVKKVNGIIDFVTKHFHANKDVVDGDLLVKLARKKDKAISYATLASYVDASKFLNKNNFDQFGLSHWAQIKPRGVRDKAYMILKKQKNPLHFSEVANLINNEFISGRRAHIQTVHNELIKDNRFVLVGRGIYALDEWGYQPGTVIDVMKQILKENSLLTKDQVLKEVLKKRLIKENTILINLQNRKIFKRSSDDKYFLA